MSPDAALAVCRFLHYSSAMLLWGASAYLAALVPQDLAQDVGRRLRSFRIVVLAVALASTAAALPLEAAVIGEGWPQALDPDVVGAVLFATSVGAAWQVQAVAAVILAAAFVLLSGSRQAPTALASGLFLATVALAGHAVMQEGWLDVAHRLNDAVHVLGAGAWLGALVPLVPILRALDDHARRSTAGIALRRFSTAGHVAVVLVIASGIGNTILVLGRWPTDWSSPYQAMLAAKIVLVTIMIGLAAVNRYVFVPRLAARQASAAQAIRLGTVAEIGLGLGVVALVSVFGALDPT